MPDIFSEIFLQATLPSLGPLAPEQEQLLSELTIDENSPGTILQDFQTLIDFLQPNGIEVSGVYSLLPLKFLPELNSRLSHPIETNLKRPVQKSYPYINGLYLLLRASGLGQIKHQGKKQTLVLDPIVLESWLKLNPTERYFTLLETWMIFGNAEILGERYNDTGNLIRCLQFCGRIPDKGLTIPKNVDDREFSYYPGLYNLALMHLFGFLEIETGKPLPGKGWRVNCVKRLPLGNAMLQLLLDILVKKQFVWDGENNTNPTFGELQPVIKHFFPEWKNNLVVKSQDFTDGIYIFKISLGKAWRRIAIPASLDLDWLSSSILKAFEFDSDHLYLFIYVDRFGRTRRVNHPYCEEPPFTNQIRVGDLPIEVGSIMTFLFDFGDNWKFLMELEQINPPNPRTKKPKLLETHGTAPKQYWSEEDEEEEEE